MFDGFFGQYAFFGLVLFLVFLVLVILEGLLLNKIFKKKWVVFLIVFLGVLLFYYVDLDNSFLCIIALNIFTFGLKYIFKKK